jgi:hypothetical protein
MKYAPKNLKLDPADYGFTVLRKYEPVDNADDVKQNADGSWTIKSGARVRVRLTMVAQARRYHVALVDNLPAGLEILNPGLAVTEAIPNDTEEIQASPPTAVARTVTAGITGDSTGLSIRISATNAPRLSVRCCGKVSTTTPTSHERQRRASSLFHRRRRRRCITQRLSVGRELIS